MKVIREYVNFRMPKSREYQFPAMAIVQAFVNGYDIKMKMNNVMPSLEHTFELHYKTDLSEEARKFFTDAGIKLTYPEESEPFSQLDMEVDLTEDMALAFFGSLKHVVQVYGHTCGINASSFPEIRTVAQCAGWKVAVLRGFDPFSIGLTAEHVITGEQLLHVRDGELTCVIGYAGWETYLAAAMGLYVAELKPPTVPRNWLSKWRSPFYYVLDSEQLHLLPRMLEDMRGHHVIRQKLALEKKAREEQLAEVTQ